MGMRFQVDVVLKETHTIQFDHSRVTGALALTVDGESIPTQSTGHRTWTLTQVRPFLFGNEEKHEARVVLRRPLLFAAFRKWKYQLYVNNELVHECAS